MGNALTLGVKVLTTGTLEGVTSHHTSTACQLMPYLQSVNRAQVNYTPALDTVLRAHALLTPQLHLCHHRASKQSIIAHSIAVAMLSVTATA